MLFSLNPATKLHHYHPILQTEGFRPRGNPPGPRSPGGQSLSANTGAETPLLDQPISSPASTGFPLGTTRIKLENPRPRECSLHVFRTGACTLSLEELSLSGALCILPTSTWPGGAGGRDKASVLSPSEAGARGLVVSVSCSQMSG